MKNINRDSVNTGYSSMQQPRLDSIDPIEIKVSRHSRASLGPIQEKSFEYSTYDGTEPSRRTNHRRNLTNDHEKASTVVLPNIITTQA